MKSEKLLLVIILTCITISYTKAGIEKFNNILNPISVSGQLEVSDAMFPYMQSNPTWINDFWNVHSSGRVALTIDEGNMHVQDNYTSYEVKVGISYFKYDFLLQGFMPGYTEKTLTISYNNLDKYTEKSYVVIDGAQWMSVNVISVNSDPTPVNANIKLEGEIEVERYYRFNPGTITTINATKITTSTENEIEFNWDIISGAEEYDLEWTYINDYDGTTTSGTYNYFPPNIDNNVFKQNSTRITTTSNTYKIPMVYGMGYILYRVRGVGRKVIQNSNGDSQIYTLEGVWSDNNVPAYNNVIGYPDKIVIYSPEGHEQNKNWQFSINFAEEGKNSFQAKYFDGTLRARQSIGRDNKNLNVIVGETIYDDQGRPAVETLPVPVVGNSKVQYYNNFNNVSVATPYDYSDFHYNAPPSPMWNQSGASFYYSPLNSQVSDYLPDANGFPFSQTIYTKDNTGRIRAKSGIGENHTIGSNHETKYFYGTPFQEELDPLFGDEVGYAEHYKKTITVDPNGQANISIYDKDNHVIATSLAGAPPENLDEVEGLTVEQVNADLTQYNVSEPIDGTLTVNKQILIDSPGPSHFTYGLTGNTYTENCPGTEICYPCIYNLVISLTDDNNEYLNYTHNGGGMTTSTVIGQDILTQLQTSSYTPSSPCNGIDYPVGGSVIDWNTNNGVDLGTPETLPVGEYSLQKELTVNQEALHGFLANYLANNSCLLTFEDFLAGQMAQLNISGCNSTCEICNADLGVDLAAYNSTHTEQITQDEWDEYRQQCDELCDDKSPLLDTYFSTLLSDVSINGQYGELYPGGNMQGDEYNPPSIEDVIDPSSFPLSVFNSSNFLPRKQEYLNNPADPTSNFYRYPNWKYPYNPHFFYEADKAWYYDENDNKSFVSITVTYGTGTNSNNIISTQPAIDPSLLPMDPTSLTNLQSSGRIIYVSGNQYKITPEKLTLQSFVDNWNDSWAKSLVYYHPEYGYYEFYKQLDDLGTSHLSSLDFDYNFVQITTVSAALTFLNNQSNWFDGSSFTVNDIEQDPFFANINDIDPSINLNQVLGLLQHYVTNPNNSSQFLSMWQLACLISNCPTGDPDCINCSYSNNSDYPDLIDTDEKWNRFKSMYLSFKQSIIDYVAKNKAISGNYYNGCIGETSYSPFADNFIFSHYLPYPANDAFAIYMNFPTFFWLHRSQFFFPAQPCNCYDYDYYSGKVRRFETASHMVGQPSNNTECYSPDEFGQVIPCPSLAETIINETENANNMYLQQTCNQCPLARSIQFLLGALVNNNALLSSSELLTCEYPEFTQDLENALGFTSNSEVYWSKTGGTTDEFIGTLNDGSTQNCEIRFKIKNTNDQTYYDLSNIIGFSSLHAISNPTIYPNVPGHNFAVTALVPTNTLDVDNYINNSDFCEQRAQIELEGYIECIDIANCPMEPICSPSNISQDILFFLSYFSFNTSAFNTHIVTPLTGNEIDDFITDNMFAELDQNINPSVSNSVNTLSVSIPAGSNHADFTFSMNNDQNNGTCNIEITIPTPYNFSQVQYYTAIKPDPASNDPHYFLVTALVNNSGTYEYIDINGYSSCFDFGTCAEEIPEWMLGTSNETLQNNGFVECNILPFGNQILRYPFQFEGNNNNFVDIVYTGSNECTVHLEFYPGTNYLMHDISHLVSIIPDESQNIPGVPDYSFIAIALLNNGEQVQLQGESSCPVVMCFETTNLNCQANSAIQTLQNAINDYINNCDNNNCQIQSGTPFQITLPGVLSLSSVVLYNSSFYNTGIDVNSIEYITDLHSIGPEITHINGSTNQLFAAIAHVVISGIPYEFEISGIYYCSLISSNSSCLNIQNCNNCNITVPVEHWDFENYSSSVNLNDMCLSNLCILTGLQQQDLGFSSGYQYNDEFDYTPVVSSTIKIGSPQFDFGTDNLFDNTVTDHTTTSNPGNVLVAVSKSVWNDDQNTNDFSDIVWSKDVAIAPYSEYEFSVWINTHNKVYESHPNLPVYIDLGLLDNNPLCGSGANVNNFYSIFESRFATEEVDNLIVPIPPTSTGIQFNYSTDSKWIKLKGTFTAGNQNNIKLAIRIRGAELNVVALDDIELTRTTCPAQPSDIMCNMPVFPSYCGPVIDDCVQQMTNLAYANAASAYQSYMDSVTNHFMQEYTRQCLNVNETFTMDYTTRKGVYTLYYYDQAGNLVRTVPPAGVNTLTLADVQADIDADRTSTDGQRRVFTTHEMSTVYNYNSLNQLVNQYMPDHIQFEDNLTNEDKYNFSQRFYYDALGRLVVSQNSKQFRENPYKYTYSLYDNLNRVIETGEVITSTDVGTRFVSSQIKQIKYNNLFLAWIANGTRTQVVKTYYDEPKFTTIPLAQENLRNRVASVTYEENADNDDNTYDNASHYCYDIHGNVKSLLQENKQLQIFSQAFKRTDYEYDLISGKVIKVTYQKGQSDQFMHKYEYDTNNRLTNVWTSEDGSVWEQDAKYFYYPHGPLSRLELGNNKVQGIDYAYTIQGWLKGVNSNSIVDETRDMGKDSKVSSAPNPNQYVGKDVFGFSLGYFENDYNAIHETTLGANNFLASLPGSYPAFSKGLFNGNISNMTIVNQAFVTGNNKPLFNFYRYDQLNRIKESSVLNGNSFDLLSNSIINFPATQSDEYITRYAYDLNGNLVNTKRKDQGGLPLDNLNYSYWNDPLLGKKNKLMTVQEIVPPTSYGNDFDVIQDPFDNTDINNNNYNYDELGNLKKDKGEEIASIEWTLSGKVKKIIHNSTSTTTKTDLDFYYDAMGNRVAKIVKPRHSGVLSNEIEWTTTYYVRDAQGNIMAIYNGYYTHISGNSYKKTLELSEIPLYGSARLGLLNKEDKKIAVVQFSTNIPAFNTNGTFNINPLMASLNIPPYDKMCVAGDKQFELTDHLGNVLGVVPDRKVASDEVYQYVSTSDPLANFELGSDGIFSVPSSLPNYKILLGTDGLVSVFNAPLISAQDYYAGGMLMSGRSYNSNSYRFGFQKQEKDDEIFGSDGSLYAFKFRMDDARLIRFWSIDPLASKYPSNSPYAFSQNRLIDAIELEGMEAVQVGEKEYNFSGKSDEEIENMLNDEEFDKSTHGLFTVEDFSGKKNDKEFWNVYDNLDTYNKSTGTTVQKFASKASYKEGKGIPFSMESRKTFIQNLYSLDDLLDSRKGMKTGLTIAAGTWGALLSGGTIAGAELGGWLTALEYTNLALSVDQMSTGTFNGKSMLDALALKAGGKNLLSTFQGAKLFVSTANLTKGMFELSFSLANGGQVNATWDFINEVWVSYDVYSNAKGLGESIKEK